MRFNSKELRHALMAAAVEGFYSADIDGWDLKNIRTQADKLRDKGLLFPAHHPTLAGRTAKYFDTAEKAEAFKAEREKQRVPKANKPPYMRQIVIAKPKTRAGWGPEVEPVITSQTKVTIAPPPPRALWTNTYSEMG